MTAPAAEWIDQKERQVAFVSGKASIVANSDPLLADVAAAIKVSGATRIVIEVYTDPRGSEVFNQALSQARAAAVRQWLIDRGNVEAAMLVAEGRGENKPMVVNTPNRQKSAHTEFRIVRAASPEPAHPVSVQGSLAPELIRQVVRAGAHDVRACYDKALSSAPALRGTATLRWVIAADGGVSSCETKSSDLHSAELEGCMCQAVKTWTFAKPRGGGVVVVNYPFVLQAPAPGP